MSGANRRFEAVVAGAGCAEDPISAPPDHRQSLESLLEEASVCGLEVVIAGGERPPAPAAVSLGRPHRREWLTTALSQLWERGVWPEQTLVIASTPAASAASAQTLTWLLGGRAELIEVLRDQIRRRAERELPTVVGNRGWVLTLEHGDPRRERVDEALTTLSDGRVGTRGSTVVPVAGSSPSVLMAGIYGGAGADTHLLSAPRWNVLAAQRRDWLPARRVLDLRTGTLHQRLEAPGSASEPPLTIDATLISSLARPGTAALRARGSALTQGPALVSRSAGREGGNLAGCQWLRTRAQPASITGAALEDLSGLGTSRSLERVVSYEGSVSGAADPGPAIERARQGWRLGFDRLLREHRIRWARRWEASDVRIEGDPELQLAVRLCLFHLIGSVGDSGEAAVGARGLSGHAYRGHVFWDSDVFVLPFLAATHPSAARSMLEYRVRRLPAAARAAHGERRTGARFPWESARSGHDVTPEHGRDPGGSVVPILTGELEQHIVADVAWAAACYIDWTGDIGFSSGAGLELVVDCARWWASRIELDTDGSAHIRDVIGPDEYHLHVDDNAFTNVMARWNLRYAARLAGDRVDAVERHGWLELADRIVDNLDRRTGIYEQFSGFAALEPLLVAEVAPRRPVAADLLLGPDRVRASQVIKQADALMLHYLIPAAVEPGSLQPNLDFYDPRTAHGSTLSPGVHATLMARAGRIDEALELLRLTARIDLDDTGHMTAGGLHLAAMGSVWRTLAYGFAGVRPEGGALRVDPVMPEQWESLQLQVRFRDAHVRLTIGHDEITATSDRPVRVSAPDGRLINLDTRAERFAWTPNPERSRR